MSGGEINGLSPTAVRGLIDGHEDAQRREDLRAAMIVSAMTGVKPWDVFGSLERLRPLPSSPEEFEAKILSAFGLTGGSRGEEDPARKS